jgi:hypothetical protein
MRTSTTITEKERNAYDLFCQQHHILNDQSAEALRNGENIGTYICTTWNENITEHTLTVALEKLRARLVFIPAEQVEAAEILSTLDQGQRDIVASWLSHQHRLEVEGPKGFSNVSVLVAWLLNRRYAVTEAGLDMALGNVQNTGKRKIFWKENPKQSREYVQGKRNHAHAFGQTEEPKAADMREREYVNGRKNHSYVEQKSGNEPSKPERNVDAWKEIVDLYMRRWTTHGQKATLEAEYNRGIQTGKSWREIGASLGQIVKSWERGR